MNPHPPHPLTVASLVLELLVPTVIVSQSSRACLGVQNMMLEAIAYGRYIDIEVIWFYGPRNIIVGIWVVDKHDV